MVFTVTTAAGTLPIFTKLLSARAFAGKPDGVAVNFTRVVALLVGTLKVTLTNESRPGASVTELGEAAQLVRGELQVAVRDRVIDPSASVLVRRNPALRPVVFDGTLTVSRARAICGAG